MGRHPGPGLQCKENQSVRRFKERDEMSAVGGGGGRTAKWQVVTARRPLLRTHTWTWSVYGEHSGASERSESTRMYVDVSEKTTLSSKDQSRARPLVSPENPRLVGDLTPMLNNKPGSHGSIAWLRPWRGGQGHRAEVS